MKYSFWIHESRLEYLQKQLSVTVLECEKDMINVQVTINYGNELIKIFYAGYNNGFDKALNLQEVVA